MKGRLIGIDGDGRVTDFLERPLEEYRYLWLDTTYLKVRRGGWVVSVTAIIATDVKADGRREVRGLSPVPSETLEFWVKFLRGLVRCGLRGVQLVISDAHEGLKAAIAQVLNVTWQRCRVHFMRTLLVCVPKRSSYDRRMPFLPRRVVCAHDTGPSI